MRVLLCSVVLIVVRAFKYLVIAYVHKQYVGQDVFVDTAAPCVTD